MLLERQKQQKIIVFLNQVFLLIILTNCSICKTTGLAGSKFIQENSNHCKSFILETSVAKYLHDRLQIIQLQDSFYLFLAGHNT